MTELFKDGAGIIFMKVGTHAAEDLSTIIARKRREIEEAGFALWGYGGNTCNPTTMVQPFAEHYAEVSGPVLLCMQPMVSKHFAEPIRASEFSVDGVKWNPIPDPIHVRGSRFALCIDSLDEVHEELHLESTRVGVGISRGKAGSDYVKGRVDKACLQVGPTGGGESRVVTIEYVARVIEPFAVFVRN